MAFALLIVCHHAKATCLRGQLNSNVMWHRGEADQCLWFVAAPRLGLRAGERGAGSTNVTERAAWKSSPSRQALPDSKGRSSPRLIRRLVVSARRGKTADALLALLAGVRSNVEMPLATTAPFNGGLHITGRWFGQPAAAAQLQR